MIFRNVFSMPVSQKHQISIKRRLIIFSSALFLLIFVIGSITFVILMEQNLRNSLRYELTKSVELERLRFEASVNTEITIVLKMADSPLIKRYFSNPGDLDLEKLAIEEINAYWRALAEESVFWVNDNDKIFHFADFASYRVDPQSPENYWYNMTLYETDVYNFNINYNPHLNVTNLWVNAPVFDNEGKPIGMVGTGINLSNFINNIYRNYSGFAELYFINDYGEITGARNIDLVADKVSIRQEIGINSDEFFIQLSSLKNSEIGNNEIRYFNTLNKRGLIVFGTIPTLNWHIIAVHYFTIGETLQTGMTVLFIVLIAVILAVFTIFNIFTLRLLKPLYKIVKEIVQFSGDWDLKRPNEFIKKDEIGTLGEFLFMTIIDQLTGIYNRRFFDGNMKKIIKALSRTGGKLSLLMIDIDFFKNYNDTYGHNMGDQCLREVASALSKIITREEDFIARYGGEEFVAVLPNTDENGAILIAERMLKKIHESNILHEKSDIANYVTVSIGVTTSIVKHTHDENIYIEHADIALYKSKQSGRNKYTFVTFEDLLE